MTAGPADPPAIGPRATLPPAWSVPFAWTGAVLFVLSLSYLVYSYVFRFGRAAEGDIRARAILVDVALFTVFAAHHSLFARSGAKAWLSRATHPAVERSIYVWIASLLLIVVCWRWEFVAGVVYGLEGPWAWIGYTAQACGVLLTAQGSKALNMLDLAGVRAVVAAREGPDAQDQPLVTTGVYGFVRHPLYLGWALMAFGAPHMTATRFVFAVVSTTYIALAIPWEERGLVREFGPAYHAYRRKVRWRMVPGLY